MKPARTGVAGMGWGHPPFAGHNRTLGGADRAGGGSRWKFAMKRSAIRMGEGMH